MPDLNKTSKFCQNELKSAPIWNLDLVPADKNREIEIRIFA